MFWMIVPLAMTIWFSLQRYSLLNPLQRGFSGFENYRYLAADPALWIAMLNTLVLVGWVLLITVAGGLLLAILLSQEFYGRPVARLLAVAPFFVMPTVGALIWKNMLFHPVNGLFGFLAGVFGLPAVDWFGDFPMTSIVIIIAWQWTPFALLVFLTALQSLDRQQQEAARLDGAGPFALYRHIILPHLRRPIAMVVMIETIFFLTLFAEIFVTTGGGPGLATTNLAYLIYLRALFDFNIGVASAGGIIAILLANIVALFLLRTVARSMDE